MSQYDYIIAGAGCAGLSLLVRMLDDPALRDKRILLVDQGPKTVQDRTWCFWEEAPGLFEAVVCRQWSQLRFHTYDFSTQLHIAPYTYKMIRSIDFYRYCFQRIAGHANVEIRYGRVESVTTMQDHAAITLSGETFTAEYIFSSIPKPLVKQPGKHYLLQHFKGWMIETGTASFEDHAATLMDFRMPQEHGACFMYVLPLSAHKAMVECTFFSKAPLPDAAYDDLLRNYLATYLKDTPYVVTEEEKGAIPMTNHAFAPAEGRIIYLGTAGGQTKPSTGYTFRFIQSHSERLVAQLAATGHPYIRQQRSGRFLWYDTVLLRVLSEGRVPAATIFGRLFRYNQPQQVLKFLDNETGFTEELRLIASLPVMPFLSAALKELRRM